MRMNTDPLGRIGSVEITRAGLLKGAFAVGVAVVTAGCEMDRTGPHPGVPGSPFPTPTETAPSVDPSASPEAAANPAIPAPHPELSKSSDQALAKLGRYEGDLGYGFAENMLFVGMPRDTAEAEQQAGDLAKTLKEYAHQGVRPIIIMEPTYNGGKDKADLAKLTEDKDGTNEPWNRFFQTLNWAGVTDDQLGTVVPFPEPNLPEWGGAITNAGTFRANFTRVAQAIKTHFRRAEVSILLDSTTYRDGDTKWATGVTDPVALLPYVTGIPQGLVDSICLQGFPWQPGDRAEDYLNAQTALTLAARAGVKKIWFNTGSFSSRVDETGRKFVADQDERLRVLGEALAQADAVRRAGSGDEFKVRMNIFAQNDTDERAPDWSYAPADYPALRSALYAAAKAGIPVSLFDAK